jgi:hypothetical protein
MRLFDYFNGVIIVVDIIVIMDATGRGYVTLDIVVVIVVWRIVLILSLHNFSASTKEHLG